MKTKTVNLDEKLHNKLKDYCKNKNLKINELLDNMVNDYLNFELKDKSLLPLILKNKKGDIYETITCIEISPEYKNSLPKSLTLVRNSSDGTGFIANYKQV